MDATMSTIGADLLRNLLLAVPLALVIAVTVARHVADRLAGRVPAAVLATLYAWVAVLAVEQVQGWWTFASAPTTLAGMPLEVSLGWALTWGALPVLAGGSPLAWWLGFAWVDLLLMPGLAPLVVLADRWWLGEGLLLAVAAAPALLLGYATRTRRLLGVRVALQATLFAGLFGWLAPTLALTREGLRWTDVVDHPYPVRALFLAGAVLAGVPALAAVVELARNGGGTPFPWDPPVRLVTTGPYAYLANPMQAGATALLALLALAAGSWLIGSATLVAATFSVVLAGRHERAVLGRRWAAYTGYRRQVRAWLPRWRPWVARPATLWVSRDCALCAATADMLTTLRPVGLETRAAETASFRITRMRWSRPAADGTIEIDRGVSAFARALEHSSLPWAWLAWCLRLPGIHQVLQLIADACGLGPRAINRQQPTSQEEAR